MVGSGALSLPTWSRAPSQPFPKRHQGPGNSSTRWAPRSKLCSTTQTSTRLPPQANMVANPEAGLGWNCSLGKTARFAGLKAGPPVIRHRSTRLGVQAHRKDSLRSRSTHTHPPAADQGILPPTNGTARHSPNGRAQLEQCPLGVLGQCLDLTAAPRPEAALCRCVCGQAHVCVKPRKCVDRQMEGRPH